MEMCSLAKAGSTVCKNGLRAGSIQDAVLPFAQTSVTSHRDISPYQGGEPVERSVWEHFRLLQQHGTSRGDQPRRRR